MRETGDLAEAVRAANSKHYQEFMSNSAYLRKHLEALIDNLEALRREARSRAMNLALDRVRQDVTSLLQWCDDTDLKYRKDRG